MISQFIAIIINDDVRVTYNGQVIAALIVCVILVRRFLTHNSKHICLA